MWIDSPECKNLNKCPLRSPILVLYCLAYPIYSNASSSKSFSYPENKAGFSSNASDDITASAPVSYKHL